MKYPGGIFPQDSNGVVSIDMGKCHGIVCCIGRIFELFRTFDFEFEHQ